jgi:hypothetical protein
VTVKSFFLNLFISRLLKRIIITIVECDEKRERILIKPLRVIYLHTKACKTFPLLIKCEYINLHFFSLLHQFTLTVNLIFTIKILICMQRGTIIF